MGEGTESTIQRRTAQVKSASERFMRFVETGKAILGFVSLIVVSAVGVITWGAQHVAWASDVQAVAQKSEIRYLEGQLRYVQGKIDDLSDQIFAIDKKADKQPEDIALRNRLDHRRDQYEADLRELSKQRTELLRK